MRIASYNLFEGAQDTFPQLIKLAVEEDFDILALQEVNGWQEDDFAKAKDFAKAANMPYFAFADSNTRFKLATFSKTPILGTDAHSEGFWHAALETQVAYDGAELTIFNTHLNPRSEEDREGEAKKLLGLVDLGKSVLITGDLNSLSSADHYPDGLYYELKKRGISKFGKEAIKLAVTDELVTAGLVDVAARLGTAETTVPTDFNTDKNHEVPLRLDYMFATTSLLSTVKDLRVIKSPQTNAISDHYPIVLELK
jgi:exodeoxyribonuclease-3